MVVRAERLDGLGLLMSASLITFLALASVDVSVEKLQYDVHANARLALRDDHPDETLKLWFLQNSLESTSQEAGPYGDDFHSLAWTALSRLGICAEGLAKDSQRRRHLANRPTQSNVEDVA